MEARRQAKEPNVKNDNEGNLQGKKVTIRTAIMAPWGWQEYPPPVNAGNHVAIEDGTQGIVVFDTGHPEAAVTVDYIDERNVLCRTTVERQYVHFSTTTASIRSQFLAAHDVYEAASKKVGEHFLPLIQEQLDANEYAKAQSILREMPSDCVPYVFALDMFRQWRLKNQEQL